MELTVFLAVLAAALMHASWNLLVKLKLDRFLSLFLLQTLMGLMGIAMLFLFAWPARASLPYVLVSGVLHTGYNIFLARSYRDGDLSLVYPIARGAAPLITLLATWLVASEQISASNRHCHRHTGIWHMAGCGWKIKISQTRQGIVVLCPWHILLYRRLHGC